MPLDKDCLKTELSFKDLFSDLKYKFLFEKEHPDYFYPDGCIVFCGSQGSGKTLSAVRYLDNLCKRYPKAIVVSNCFLALPSYKGDYIPYEGIKQLQTLDNGYSGIICFLDEIQSEFSSLESSKIHPSVLQVISMQRKRRLHVVGTSQLFKRIAKPWREQISSVIDCSNVFGFLQRNSHVDFTSIAEDSSGNLLEYKHAGNYYFFRSPKYYGMYDTFEKVKRKESFN